MLQTSAQIDPIVEILRLAYRRGLALRQERERIESLNSDRNDPDNQAWIDTGYQSKALKMKPGGTLS